MTTKAQMSDRSKAEAAEWLRHAVEAMMDSPSTLVDFKTCYDSVVWKTLTGIMGGYPVRMGDLAVAMQHIADTMVR